MKQETTPEFRTKAGLMSRLLASFADFSGSEADAAAKARAYMMAIENLPTDVIREAVERYAGGHVKGQNTRYPPTTAEFCREVRNVMELRAAEAKRAAQPALPPPDEPRDVPVTPEARQRGAELWARVRETLVADDLPGGRKRPADAPVEKPKTIEPRALDAADVESAGRLGRLIDERRRIAAG